jgi:hypothetical protein
MEIRRVENFEAMEKLLVKKVESENRFLPDSEKLIELG